MLSGGVVVGIIPRVFFFSSRRRHTRLQGDWSSDVCSSDLGYPRPRRDSRRAVRRTFRSHSFVSESGSCVRADLRHVCDWKIEDRKSTRLNSSHLVISYAVFCLKKKKIIMVIVHLITEQCCI